MYVKKETVLEHFNKPIKSVGRGRFLKKLRINIIRRQVNL